MIEIKRRKGSDDYAAVTMSLDFSVPDRVEQMGFLAHRCGVYRQDNPYTDLVDPSSAPTSAEAAKALEEAWWRGWDGAASRASRAPAGSSTRDDRMTRNSSRDGDGRRVDRCLGGPAPF
jgi:hypothetical protein